ncbi:MAG: ACT domain-containing protein [Pseudomonadota bacterium]
MTGEMNLENLIAGMDPVLAEGTFVFATLPDATAIGEIDAKMWFHEVEGITLILPRDAAEAAGIAYEFPCRMITLNVHSALDAVGFLARITAALAGAGMGVNPVSAFFHDHLFVPAERAEEAMAILTRLRAEFAATPPA